MIRNKISEGIEHVDDRSIRQEITYDDDEIPTEEEIQKFKNIMKQRDEAFKESNRVHNE